jgi:23S rRNA (uracil1939-C5)-methyltransferase
MHLRVEAQRAAKAEIVRESLRRVGRLDADDVDRVVRSGDAVDPLRSRTSLRVIGDRDRRPSFRREASDETVAVERCSIAHPNLDRVLDDLEIEPGLEVELRTSVATGAVTARWKAPRQKGRNGSGKGSGKASPTRLVDGLPDDVHVGERAFLVESVAGNELRVSAASFFQSSAQAADLLVDAVQRSAPELATAAHVLDAYGGVGLFAVAAAPAAGRVTVVESSRSACFDAEHNLTGRDARVVRRDVGRWENRDVPVDVVVADPARSGLGKPGVAALGATAPAPLVLVSCDPVSLARDATLLRDTGYAIDSVEVLDVFPQTRHVETVTRFTHREDR